MLSWAIYKYTSTESTYILLKKIDSLYATRFKMKKKLFLHHYVQLSYSKLEKGELQARLFCANNEAIIFANPADLGKMRPLINIMLTSPLIQKFFSSF